MANEVRARSLHSASRARWKAVERWMASFFGGKRIPVTGRQGKDRESKDIATPYPHTVDVKSRKVIPKYLYQWLGNLQAVCGANHPVVILHRPGTEYKTALVLLNITDYKELLVKAYGNPTGNDGTVHSDRGNEVTGAGRRDGPGDYR